MLRNVEKPETRFMHTIIKGVNELIKYCCHGLKLTFQTHHSAQAVVTEESLVAAMEFQSNTLISHFTSYFILWQWRER